VHNNAMNFKKLDFKRYRCHKSYFQSLSKNTCKYKNKILHVRLCKVFLVLYGNRSYRDVRLLWSRHT